MSNLTKMIQKRGQKALKWLEHDKMEKILLMIPIIVMLSCVAVFADNAAAAEVKEILSNFSSIIYLVFQGIGFILGLYGAGTLIMAFKNDDPDSKIRSGTVLIISVVLLLFPTVVQSLGILDRITG